MQRSTHPSFEIRPVSLEVRLPSEVAAEAQKLQRTEPDLLNRIVLLGMTQRTLYHRLGEPEGTRPLTGRSDGRPET